MGIVRGSLPQRAYFESLRAAEAKKPATINQLKYRSRSCIMENIALGAWSPANKAHGCASCFIGSRSRPHAIFPIMHSHGTLCSRRTWDWDEILRIHTYNFLGYTRRASAAQLRINIHTRSRVISIAHPVLTISYVCRETMNILMRD